jgi:hypothetical protein
MTSITLTAGTVRPQRVPFVATAFFAEFLAGAREGLEIEARYDTLRRMSAADLAKRGLTRADIGHAAVTGKDC